MKIKLIISTVMLLLLAVITINTNLTTYLKTNMIVACSIFYIIHTLITIANVTTKQNERKYKF